MVSSLFSGTTDVSLGGSIPFLGLKLLDQQSLKLWGMENKNLTSVPLEVTVREAAPIFYTRFLDLRILVLRKWAHILITDLQHMLRLGRHCLSSKRC